MVVPDRELWMPSGGPWTITQIAFYEPCSCTGLRAVYHEIFERHQGKMAFVLPVDPELPVTVEGGEKITVTFKPDGTFTLE